MEAKHGLKNLTTLVSLPQLVNSAPKTTNLLSSSTWPQDSPRKNVTQLPQACLGDIWQTRTIQSFLRCIWLSAQHCDMIKLKSHRCISLVIKSAISALAHSSLPGLPQKMLAGNPRGQERPGSEWDLLRFSCCPKIMYWTQRFPTAICSFQVPCPKETGKKVWAATEHQPVFHGWHKTQATCVHRFSLWFLLLQSFTYLTFTHNAAFGHGAAKPSE